MNEIWTRTFAAWKGPVRAALFLFLVALSSPVWGQSPSSEKDLIGRAREAYNNRHFQEAAEVYKNYLDKYPNGDHRDEAGFFHAHSLYLSGDNEKADKAFAREESENGSYRDQILYYRGQLASRKGEYTRALVFFDRLLAEHPDSRMRFKARNRSAEIHYRVGNRYLAENAVSMAMQHYSQAVNGPSDLQPLVLYKLGLCHQRTGKPDRAVEIWGDLSLKEDKDSTDAARIARYRLARLLEDREQLMQAEVNFQTYVETCPDHFLAPLAREGLARVWAKQGKKEKAIEFWKKQGKSRERIEAAELFAEALDHYLYEEYPDAVKKFRMASAKTESKELAICCELWLARTYMAQGDIAKARGAWQKFLGSYGDSREYNRIEYARFLLDHDPEEAGKVAAGLRSHNGGPLEEALYIIARSAFMTSDKGALSAADRYFIEYPQGMYRGEVSLLRGREYFEKGKTDEAVEDLKTALKYHGGAEGRLEAARLLSRIYLLEGRKSSAAEVLRSVHQDALSLLSEAEKLTAAEAETAYSRGEYSKGVEIYEEICSRKGGCPPETRYRLFWGHYRTGDTVSAREALDKVETGSAELKFRAGLWRGIMLQEAGKLEEAEEALNNLNTPGPVCRGLGLWMLSRLQVEAGSLEKAMSTLSSLESGSPAAGIYVKGEILRLALESGDFKTYLSSLPDPSEMDRRALSEESLLGSIRSEVERHDPYIEAIKEYLAALRVVSLHQESVEEGVFWLAKARLKKGERDKALEIMSDLLTQNPSTTYAQQMRFYHGEDAFLRNDYQGAISWLKSVRPEDLPDREKRFRLLYLKGQAHKKVNDLESMRPYFLEMARDYSDQTDRGREWLNVGIGLVLTREFTGGRTALDIVIANSSSKSLQAEALYWKGMAEQGSGDLDAALHTFLEIPDKYPRQDMWVTTALYEAGQIYTRKGDYDRALEMYNRVLSRTKGDKKTTDKVKAKIAEVKKLKRLESGGKLLPSLP